MRQRFYFTELGNILGNVIDAIAYALVHTPISKFMVRTLLLGGVTALTLGPFVSIVYFYSTGEPLDAISVPVGVALISLAFLVFLVDRAFARYPNFEIFVEPVSSFFEADKMPTEERDPKYIEGNGFTITAHVRLKAGKAGLSLIKADLYGYSGGLSLFATTQTFRLSGEEILWLGTEHASERRNVCQTHRVNGNYEFQPPIEITGRKLIAFSVTRHFHGPFIDEGAPIDFANSDLKLSLQYDANGRSSEAVFLFSSSYQSNGLTPIRELSSVPYFSNRQIAYWHQRKAITREERDSLLKMEQEVRRRVIRSDDKIETLISRWERKGASYRSILLLKKLSQRYDEMPDFDENAIWTTPHGKLASWLIQRLRSNK